MAAKNGNKSTIWKVMFMQKNYFSFFIYKNLSFTKNIVKNISTLLFVFFYNYYDLVYLDTYV